MLQGTGSDVGKSLLVAGLCRAFTRRGLAVRPFKPQNMSNNAAVTADGGEIGRAQALQARACGVALASDMNPVLLKPETETGAQVVVQGKMWCQAAARDYQALKPQLLEAATSNAREQATRFAEDAGATLGRLKNANQGVIRVIDDDGSDMDSGRTVGKRLRVVSSFEYTLD